MNIVILYQLAQDSFPTDPENMNPIRQLFLVEKSIFQFFENPIKYKPILKLLIGNTHMDLVTFDELKNRFFNEK